MSDDAAPWKQVAETAQLYEAELIALRLREAGVPAEVLDQSFRQEPLPNVRSFAVVRVMVPADQLALAKEVLARSADLPPDAEPAGAEPPADEEPQEPR